MRLTNYEDIKEVVVGLGYIPLFYVYGGCDYKYPIQDKEGYKYEVVISNLISNHIPSKFNVHNNFTIENIKLWLLFDNTELQLVSNKYSGATKEMDWICPICGKIFKTTWSMIYSNGKRCCNECSIESIKQKQKHGYEYVKKYIENNTDFTLLSKEYINYKKNNLELQCNCGEKILTSFLMIKSQKIKCCKKCTYERISQERRHDINYIRKQLQNKRLTLISNNYINNTTPLIYKDSEGYFYKNNYDNISSNISNGLKFSLTNIYSIYNIKLYIKINKLNCKLLSNNYNGYKEKLKFQCKCGNTFFTSLDNLIQHNKVRCKKCIDEYEGMHNRLTYEQVKKYIEMDSNSGCKLLSTTYINNRVKLKIKCSCGEVFKTNFNKFKNNNKTKCNNCSLESIRGENSPNWNPNLTEEERQNGRKIEGYSDFIKNVLKRDKYTCQCCGKKKKLKVHHLNGYNWDKEHRTDIDNGITLCEDCHKEFHSTYGYGNNTKEQYQEYIHNKLHNQGLGQAI